MKTNKHFNGVSTFIYKVAGPDFGQQMSKESRENEISCEINYKNLQVFLANVERQIYIFVFLCHISFSQLKKKITFSPISTL